MFNLHQNKQCCIYVNELDRKAVICFTLLLIPNSLLTNFDSNNLIIFIEVNICNNIGKDINGSYYNSSFITFFLWSVYPTSDYPKSYSISFLGEEERGV